MTMLSHPRAKFKVGDILGGLLASKPENLVLVTEILDYGYYRLYSIPDATTLKLTFHLVDSCYKKIG